MMCSERYPLIGILIFIFSIGFSTKALGQSDPFMDRIRHANPEIRIETIQQVQFPPQSTQLKELMIRLCIDSQESVRVAAVDQLNHLLTQEWQIQWELLIRMQELAGIGNAWTQVFFRAPYLDYQSQLAMEESIGLYNEYSLSLHPQLQSQPHTRLDEEEPLPHWRNAVLYSLLFATEDSSIIVRTKAVYGLGLLLNRRIIPHLLHIVEQGNNSENEETNQKYYEINKSSRYNMRHEAVLALLKLIPYLDESILEDERNRSRIVSVFFDQLSIETDWKVVLSLVRGVVLLEPERSIPTLRTMIENGELDWRILEGASLALARIERIQNRDNLMHLLVYSPFEDARIAAANTLGNLAIYRTMPYLVEQLDKENSVPVLEAIIRSIGKGGDEKHVMALRSHYSQEDVPELIAAYRWALDQLGAPVEENPLPVELQHVAVPN
jgi:HEAT repeat protein